MEKIVEIIGVCKSFSQKDRTILSDVCLSLHRGESVALMGPSGSGKTTLLSIIAGLLPADKGQLSYVFKGQQPVNRLSAALRQRSVGVVFQNYHLIPTLNVTENIIIPMLGRIKDRRQRIQRARELIEALGLGHVAGQYPAELSGGEKQRVAIGRAYANHPELILADEPTGSLDSVSANKVIEALFKMTKEVDGVLLTVTHNEKIANRLDRIIEISDGRVTQ